MTTIQSAVRSAVLAAGLATGLAVGAQAATTERVQVTGEIIDTWCYLSDIMFSEGTAHHQCAIWCAVGGVPVGILDGEGNVYIVLKMEEDTNNVSNPAIFKVQTHEVSVDGDLYERDGVKYLLVNQVVDDNGIVNVNHEDWGIQPFGE